MSQETIALFAQFLCRTFKSVETVKNYVSGVKLLHILVNHSCEAFDNPNLKLAFKGMARQLYHRPKQALPITKELLLKMYEVLDCSKINDTVFWSLFLMAFFTMSRKSNLVVTCVNENVKCITRQDVLTGFNSMLVLFRWSKTNQVGGRVHKVPLVAFTGSPLCPVQAYKNMCRRLPLKRHMPAFCIVKQGKVMPVTYAELQNVLRQTITKVGLDPRNYSSHSFRRGAATLAFKAGVHPNVIQVMGDWSSDAYKRYLVMSSDQKVNAVTKMYAYSNF